MEAFISYSHKDSEYLERLKVHLANMKRQNLITEWTDNEIHAGDSIDEDVLRKLNNSEVFIALLSPDYLASKYAYEIEFKKAQELQENGSLIIVPIIVEPCDWQKTPFGVLKALPKDGKAISEWTNENNAFLNVIDELRRLIESPFKKVISLENSPQIKQPETRRNYKIKKIFSEVDKITFKEESFEIIKNYFNEAIEEINSVEHIQVKLTKMNDEYFTCLISNRANSENSYITVSISNQNLQFGDIHYQFNDKMPSGSSMQLDNLFMIENDEYIQFWSRKHLGSYRAIDNNIYDAQGLGSIIWDEFIAKVGIS